MEWIVKTVGSMAIQEQLLENGYAWQRLWKQAFFCLLFLVLGYLNSELPFFIGELPLYDMPL